MKKFNSINGLRTIACIGIILMHVKANVNYELDNEVINTIINSFTQFVHLFMIISSFSMCCGYYEKIKNNQISMNDFYKKRFSKILPFFAFLVIINTLFERTLTSVYEGFADLTLSFGFLPVNGLSAIGVAWFLGVVFVFYMIFPFFVFLFDNKNRGWGVLITSFILNILCKEYFFTESFGLINYAARNNFLYDFVYFAVGGMIYLYKDVIINFVSKNKIVSVIVAIIFTIVYYFVPQNNIVFTIEMLIIFSLWLCISIGIDNKILDNRITKFISGISMEMYLSHMIIFRIIEKLHLTKLFNNNYISYIVTSCLVIIGVIIFAVIFNKCLKFLKNRKENILSNKGMSA